MTTSNKKLLMLTDGNFDNASARIRAIQYIPFLQKNDFRVTLIPRVPKKYTSFFGRYGLFPLLKRWFLLKRFFAIFHSHWDIVFIQRTFLPESLLRHLRSTKTFIIYDFDDAIYISPAKPENKTKTAIMIKFANEVIVSTDYLKPFCMINHKDPSIIPSPVETDRIKPSIKNNETVTIGWIGSDSTSVFLPMVENPLKQLAKLYPVRFLTVGAKSGYRIEGINHVSKQWSFQEENEHISEMDIGIMPLTDTEFSRSKGGYKLIQYMSGGVPCIASPIGINKSIIKPGVNGSFASTENEWFDQLEKLIKNPELRKELGKNGRKEAIELYSREVCFEKLLNVLRRNLE